MYRLPPAIEAESGAAWRDATRPGQAGPRRRSGRRWGLLRWLVLLGVWGGVALAGVILACAWDLPRPESALGTVRRPTLALADRDGHVFATYGDVVGDPVHLTDLPPALPAAAVAIEDRRFWSHGGLDWRGTARALWIDVKARRVVQGGSTITQQVAKNLFLTPVRSFRRKVQELLLTLWLEQHFTKAQILEIWLNRIYLGSGAWGVDAAAKLYFGVPATRLSVWQCAVLAGLPRAPSRLNPWADPQAAAARARVVLATMVETGALTAAQASDNAAHIAFAGRRVASGYFADWAAERAAAAVPAGTDAVVRTTLDPRLQAAAESRLQSLLAGPGAAQGAGQGAVVALDVATGAVRAMVGGRDYRASAFNRAAAARRQPGSAFKPFVWLAALERGVRPEDETLDAPITVDGWSPRNFDGSFRGRVTVQEALAQSLNTVSVRLMQAAGGPRPVADVARRLGIESGLVENVTLALGTSEVRVLEIAAAYAAFFNGGLRVTPRAVEAVTTGGHEVPTSGDAPERVIDPVAAAAMRRMLEAVVAGGSGHAAALPGRVVAGKTGTTQDSRDAWFVGCVDGLVIAVWLGNDDGRPMRDVTGGSLPARLFHDIAADRAARPAA